MAEVVLSLNEETKCLQYSTKVEESRLDSVWRDLAKDHNKIRTVFYMKDRGFKRANGTGSSVNLVTIYDGYNFDKRRDEETAKIYEDLIVNPDINPAADNRFVITSCSLAFLKDKMRDISFERWRYYSPEEGTKEILKNHEALEMFLEAEGYEEVEGYIAKSFVVDVKGPSDKWYTIRGTKRYIYSVDSPVSRQRMDLKHPMYCHLSVAQDDEPGEDLKSVSKSTDAMKKDAKYIFEKIIGINDLDFDNAKMM